jgi:hypothetical protein
MSPEQVLQWIQDTYGVTLNDQQIQMLAGAIGFDGSNWSPEMATRAMQVVDEQAQANNIPRVTASGASSSSAGTTSPTASATGTTTSPAAGTTSSPSPTSPPVDEQGRAAFQQWFRQTFGREARPEELQNYAQAVRYNGQRIEGTLLKQLQDVAILDQKSKGWLPVAPTQFNWTPFEYQAFQYGEQAPSYQAPEAFQFNEAPPEYQAPEAFRYQEFTPPTMADITRDPAYQRRLEQGQRALETSAAAKGLLRTGATLKNLQEFGQNLASEEYQNAYGRRMGEYQTGQQQAKSAYDADVARRQDVFNAQQQGYQNRMGMARTRYESDAQRRAAQFAGDTQAWQNRFNQAQAQYATNRQSAETDFNARRQQDLLQWQRDYDVWRYLNDDAYRRAQIASTASQV